MKILACDTALGALSVAVIDGETVLAREWVEMQRGHAEQLAPMVERVMRAAGLAFGDLDRLAVTTGPGTFTGQRVGLAFMRAAALASKLPLIGITTMEGMAAAALAERDAAWAASIADAKRSEVYLGALARNGDIVMEPMLVPLADAVQTVRNLASRMGPPVLAGTAAEAMLPLLRAHGVDAIDSNIRQPDAVFVARIAATRPTTGTPPRPLYLRAPDARLPS